MSAVIRRLSTQTWSGFGDFKTYFMSLESFPVFKTIVVRDNMIVFDADASVMNGCMNSSEFRLMWNLLPAGMDIVTASCQMYVLKNTKLAGVDGLTGTYLLRIKTWQYVSESQNEAQMSQEHRAKYFSDPNSWNAAEFAICL